ncbi:MAG: hypothetical protein J2P45_15700, partial [Candidatus Dormibacteraeota bacterium]|nr:hypothetical protein [Candidatus Dormibacteraeota bacterium]
MIVPAQPLAPTVVMPGQSQPILSASGQPPATAPAAVDPPAPNPQAPLAPVVTPAPAASSQSWTAWAINALANYLGSGAGARVGYFTPLGGGAAQINADQNGNSSITGTIGAGVGGQVQLYTGDAAAPATTTSYGIVARGQASLGPLGGVGLAGQYDAAYGITTLTVDRTLPGGGAPGGQGRVVFTWDGTSWWPTVTSTAGYRANIGRPELSAGLYYTTPLTHGQQPPATTTQGPEGPGRPQTQGQQPPADPTQGQQPPADQTQGQQPSAPPADNPTAVAPSGPSSSLPPDNATQTAATNVPASTPVVDAPPTAPPIDIAPSVPSLSQPADGAGSSIPSLGSSDVGSSGIGSIGSSSIGSMGSSDLGSIGSNSVGSIGSSDLGSIGSSSVGSIGSSDLGSIGSSSVGSIGSS